MARTEDQTGTEKEVKLYPGKADAGIKKQRKNKSEKKVARKKKQPVEPKNITDIGTEKMASSLPSDNTASMPEGEASISKEINEKSPEPLLEKSQEPEPEHRQERFHEIGKVLTRLHKRTFLSTGDL